MRQHHLPFASQAIALMLAFTIIPYKTTYAQKKALMQELIGHVSPPNHRWLTNHLAVKHSDNNPSHQEVVAHAFQPWLSQINQPYAHQLSTQEMRSVTIGIADTALEVDHPQLNKKINATYSGFDNSPNAAINQFSRYNFEHATTVAGIAAGTLTLISGKRGQHYLQGVAPNAGIMIAKVFNDYKNHSGMDFVAFTKSINWFTEKSLDGPHRAKIINLSMAGLRQFTPAAITAMQNAITNDILFTIASGNESAPEPYWPAAYASAPWANGQIIAVGAVDSHNKLYKSSNAAGSAAHWFVVAPGEAIYASSINKTYTSVSGTSFAAPMVAGQAALIKAHWPQLQAHEVAQIIFQTAKHLGTSAEGIPDKVYGWGLIDVLKSLRPIGTLQIRLADNTWLPINMMSLGNVDGPMGAAIRIAADREEFVIGGATDRFNRHFSVDLGKTLPPPRSLTLSHIFASNQPLRYGDIILDSQGSRLRYTLSDYALATNNHPQWSDQAKSTKTILSGVDATQRFSNGSEFFFAIGNESASMGLADYRINGAPELTGSAFNDAYRQLIPSATHVGIGKKLEGTKLKFSFSSNQFAPILLHQARPNLTWQNFSEKQNKINLVNTEIAQQFSDTILGLGFANLSEKNSLLGTQLGTGFDFNSRASTQVLTLNVVHKLSQRTALAASFSRGATRAYDNGLSSLIRHVSATRSQTYRIGLICRDKWVTADRLSVVLSAPLATTAGKITLDIPTTINASGQLVRKQQDISLVNPAREYAAEIAYFLPLSAYSTLGLTVTHRQNANHLAKAREQLVFVNYRAQL